MQLALELARLGWRVFPCLADKRPACPHGFQDAASEPSEISMLWHCYPGPLVGIATGEVSGFDVLDIDAKHQAAVEWENRQAWATLTLSTLCLRTRGGGRHYYWQHHPGLRNSCARPVPGIDVRADGGYVIWWDSNAPSPGRVLPWPTELLAELRPPPPPRPALRPPPRLGDDNIDGLLLAVIQAHEGERNALLFWAACRCAEKIATGTITRSETEGALLHVALQIGLREPEARATIASGLRHVR